MLMNLPPLYKTSGSGKVLIWSISVEANRITTEYGYLDGKIQTEVKEIEQGTNIGRSNERNEDEQAEFEAKAKWEHQKRYKGYFETIKEAQSVKLKLVGDGGIAPMLATPFQDKYLQAIGFPNFIQPKLDGVRVTYHRGKLYSRGGEELLHFDKLIKEIQSTFSMTPDIRLDGELYLHGFALKHISGIARKQHLDFDYSNGTLDTSEKDSLQFWIFDCPSVASDADMAEAYKGRMRFVKNAVEKFNIIEKRVKVIPNFVCNDEDDLMLRFKEFVEAGYEGAIIKDMFMPYIQKRSKLQLKMKDFKEKEFPILGVNEGTGPHKGLATTFTCISPEGKLFYPSMHGSLEWRRELLNTPKMWEGKKVTVRYLQYWDGVPNCITALTKKGLKKNDIKYEEPTAVHIRPEGE